MSTPAGQQPTFIIIGDGGGGSEKMNALEKLQTLGVVAGLGVGGYLIYLYFIKDDGEGGMCNDPIIGKDGLLGGIFPEELNPACLVQSALDGILGVGKDIEGAVNQVVDKFAQMKPTGDEGVPFELEGCPAGWTDDGLICREPIGCCGDKDLLGNCYLWNVCGGNLKGKMDSGKCPDDHPHRDGLLCYKECEAGYHHVAGMPYMCEPD